MKGSAEWEQALRNSLQESTMVERIRIAQGNLKLQGAKSAHLQEANTSGGLLQQRVWHDILLTSPDFDEPSKVPTSSKSTLQRKKRQVHPRQKRSKKSNDQMYIVDSGASLHMVGESSS